MLKRIGKLQNKSININKNSISSFILIINLFFAFCCLINKDNVSASIFFTTSTPIGDTFSNINFENEYTIITSEVGSSWMFD